MKAFPHPFIVKILDDFTDSAGHLCLVQEFYPDGDFSKYLLKISSKMKLNNENLSETDILHFLANIFLSVLNLNSRDMFHRDIKPENFLMKREANGKTYLHLSDFGVAKNISDKERLTSALSNVKGTNEYLAPEIHNAKLEKPNLTKQDVWAIGVIAYELCTFHHPFKFETSQAMINAIINDPHTPIEQDYSKELKDLISCMLIKDPEQRSSI
jgi:NIMA (never in mitosis gene a)-related kinase 1/4/5